LADRTVYANIDFVLRATGWKKATVRQKRIAEVLEEVGLADKSTAFPHQLSGGEQQRISLARAMLNKPQLLIADEPTGNLDHDNSVRVLTLLKNACERGAAVVVVTHNLELLNEFPGVVYRCEDGKVIEEKQGEARKVAPSLVKAETEAEAVADETKQTVSEEKEAKNEAEPTAKEIEAVANETAAETHEATTTANEANTDADNTASKVGEAATEVREAVAEASPKSPIETSA